MNFLRRSVSVAVLVTLLVGVLGIAVQSPAVYAQDDDVPRFESAPCMFDIPAGAVEGDNLECGYLVVPAKHAEPTGPTIRLAVAIAKSTNPSPAADPLVMEQGGPGGSSIDAFIEDLFDAQEILRADRDVIIIEQRGTLYSEPNLVCQEVLELSVETLQQDLGVNEESALSEAALQACRERLITEGVDLDAFDSVENAADIADLVTAFQLSQINLYGVSYGTMLALHALRDYPQIMRSVTIDSVVPLQTNFIPVILQSANRSFRVLFDTCAADPECNAAMPNLEADFYALVEELNANPITFPVEDPDSGELYEAVLNGDRLVGYYFQLLYATSILPYLPKTVYDLKVGNTSLMSLVSPFLDLDRTFADAMYYSVICAEDADYTLDDYDLTDVPPALVAAFGEDTILTSCASWNAELLPNTVDEPVVSDVPVMVMSGEFDPITPPSFAAQAAETLSNSYNFVYPGVGHGALFGGDCPLSMFVDFLGDPTTAPDATCIDNMSIEFFLPSSAYVDPEGQFTSALPAGWDDAGDRTLVNPENGSKMVFEVVAGDDVLEGIGTAISTYDSSVDGASPLNAQDIDLANGTWKLTFYLSGSRYYIVVGIVQNGNVFVVILETNESQFENDANAVQEVLDAMSFTDGNGSVSVTPTPS